MASEENKFRIDDSLDAITEKLIRRHPHVFGDGDAKTADDVKRRWDEIKADEKKERGEAPQGILDSVPRNLPALVEAQQICVQGRRRRLRLGKSRSGARKAG